MRRLLILIALALALALIVTLAAAQTAPAWQLVFAPRDVQANDTPALTVAIAPGAASTEVVSITLPSGLELLNAEPSVGTYVGGVWTFSRPESEPATLLLRFRVLGVAQTNDDVYVRADWRGAFREGAFALHLAESVPPVVVPQQTLYAPISQTP